MVVVVFFVSNRILTPNRSIWLVVPNELETFRPIVSQEDPCPYYKYILPRTNIIWLIIISSRLLFFRGVGVEYSLWDTRCKKWNPMLFPYGDTLQNKTYGQYFQALALFRTLDLSLDQKVVPQLWGLQSVVNDKRTHPPTHRPTNHQGEQRRGEILLLVRGTSYMDESSNVDFVK